jgi:hypothetical protein
MFWQKSFIGLGILAALGNTAPFAFLQDDLTTPPNVTDSLSKRLDLDLLDGDFWVFRADK